MSALAAIPIATVQSARPALINRLALIVRDNTFDRLLSPLTFALEMGRRGVDIDMLFVLDALRVLTREGIRQVIVDSRHALREPWLRARLAEDDASIEVHGLIRSLHATGRIRIFGCLVAASDLDIRLRDLLPEVEGIIDPDVFLNDIAAHADHCQHF